MRRVGFLAFALLLVLTGVGLADAAELKCLTPPSGGTCVCSEPLQATDYVRSGDGWNANDTSTFQCSVEPAFPNAVVATGTTTTDVLVGNSSAVLNLLPSGHQVVRYLTFSDGWGGTHQVGHGADVSSSLVRLAARWYEWYSTDALFKLEGGSPPPDHTCLNTKHASIGNLSAGRVIDYDSNRESGSTGPGNFHTYNYLDGSPSQDCCASGPGPSSAVAPDLRRGKWWRYEVILTNRQSVGCTPSTGSLCFQVEMFGKNITDNSPEIQILRSRDNAQIAFWTPPSLQSQIAINKHRHGVCNGSIAIVYYMMAGWTTNAGQRIGAASEVETGGAPAPQAPVAPTGLTVGPS